MASVRSFHRYRGETSFSMARLVEIVREQLPAIAPAQTRYRVTEMPTERTIRFYTGRGLVDKPVTAPGGRKCYGYRHLLQVLAVKYLQSQYLPLVKVKAMTGGVDNRELESMMPAIAPASGTYRAVGRDGAGAWGVSTPAGAAAAPPGRPAAPAPEGAGAPAHVAADAEGTDLWHRVEVGPGVELHVHAAALTQEQREQLRGTLLRELGVFRGWFGGRGKT